MSFRIRPVYKEQTNNGKLDLDQSNNSETVDSVQSGDLTATQLLNSQMTLEQKKAAIMNQRTQVKPSARSSIRQTTFEGGFEGDMY